MVADAKTLFEEYARSLEIDLNFQDFDKELSDFPGQYSLPSGCLFLAHYKNMAIGCVGLRAYDKGICEMKRLYVCPDFRGMNVGELLCHAVIKAAKDIGYERMRLDTLPSMETAINLYKSMGFKQIAPYRFNPVEGTVYLELKLKG